MTESSMTKCIVCGKDSYYAHLTEDICSAECKFKFKDQIIYELARIMQEEYAKHWGGGNCLTTTEHLIKTAADRAKEKFADVIN